jgi:hypothetical protein
MKKINKIQIILIVYLSLFSSIVIKACIINSPANESISANTIKSVYVNEISPTNKHVLVLYKDEKYKFINFITKAKKVKTKKETGSYTLIKDEIILKPNSGKIKFEHKTNFIIKSKVGLYEKSKSKKSVTSFIYKKENPQHYTDPIYIDIDYSNFPLLNRIENLCKKKDQKTDAKSNSLNSHLGKWNYTIDTTNNYLFSINAKKEKINLSVDTLKNIKVVIVVGPVEEMTDEFINQQKKLSGLLKSIGIQVKEIYPPNDWKTLVHEAEGANLFIYSGHGSKFGKNNVAGGICLSDGIWNPDQLKADLQLSKNALILFNHVCGGAGSSASDKNDIGINEAIKRVSDYSKPFFEIGAKAYYANNYNYSLISFIKSFLNGNCIQDIHNSEANLFNYKSKSKTYKYNNEMEIAVGSRVFNANNSSGSKTTETERKTVDYNISYVGPPYFNLEYLLEE